MFDSRDGYQGNLLLHRSLDFPEFHFLQIKLPSSILFILDGSLTTNSYAMAAGATVYHVLLSAA